MYSGNTDENVQKGVLRSYGLNRDHLTASAGLDITFHKQEYEADLKQLIDKVVYWQEYADTGSKFKIDGKEYVLVPFYRLIAKEQE